VNSPTNALMSFERALGDVEILEEHQRGERHRLRVAQGSRTIDEATWQGDVEREQRTAAMIVPTKDAAPRLRRQHPFADGVTVDASSRRRPGRRRGQCRWSLGDQVDPQDLRDERWQERRRARPPGRWGSVRRTADLHVAVRSNLGRVDVFRQSGRAGSSGSRRARTPARVRTTPRRRQEA
jgi:hypothetical protein